MHECRDSHLPAVPHTKDAEEKGRTRGFGVCQNFPTCTAPTTTTPPAPQNLKTLLLKQQTQAVNDRIPAKGCRRLLVRAPGKWHGKGKYVSAVRGHHQRQGRDHWNQQVDQEEIGDTTREKRHSSRTVEGRTELDLVQDEVDEARRLREEAHEEAASSREQSDRSSIPSGTSDGGNVVDQETVGGELGASRSMRTSQKKHLLGGSQKDKKPCGKDGMRPSRKWRNYRATTTSQYSASISVRPPRRQCMQFSSTPLPTCEEEPSYNIHVFWWQLLTTKKNQHLCLQILHAATFQVLSRCTHTATSAGCHGESGDTGAS